MKEFIVSIVWIKHTDNGGRNIQNSLHRVKAVSDKEAQGISIDEYKTTLPDHYMFLIQSMEVNKDKIELICEEEEIWKDIDGYNGLYKVSNLGRVKSFQKYYNGKIMVLTLHSTRGYQLILTKNKKHKCHQITRLVWETFNKVLPDNVNVIHSDGDIHNNSLSNLKINHEQ